MRIVFPNREIAHLWAHETQRTARGSNFFFEGPSIYSYGYHFEIARIIRNKKGEKAYLFTTRDRSISTTRHKRYVLQSIPNDGPIFRIADFTDPPSIVLKKYQSAINEAIEDAGRARVRKFRLLTEAKGLAEESSKFAEFHGIKSRTKLPDGFYALLEEQRLASIAYSEKMETRQEAKRKAKEDAAIKAIPLWRSGSNLTYANEGIQWLDCAYIRISPTNAQDVETSKGACVPLEHVKRAMPLVLKLIERGEEWHTNGHSIHVGNFKLDRIEADGTVVAGCHKFKAEEVKRFAALLGITSDTKEPVIA